METFPDRRYTNVRSVDIFELFLVTSSEWFLNEKVDLDVLIQIGYDCDQVVSAQCTNKALLNSKKVKHFLTFWKLSCAMKHLNRPESLRNYFQCINNHGRDSYSLRFLNKRSIGSQKYLPYRHMGIIRYKKEPKKFPPKRHIGVGYSDKGNRQDITVDGSQSWQEVSMDADYQKLQSKFDLTIEERRLKLVHDVSRHHYDTETFVRKYTRNFKDFLKEKFLKDNLFF